MLNRQSKSIIAGAVFALVAGSALAQQAGVQPAAGNPAAQMAQESARPQNPLEEMSRLNAEVTTLRAKLNLVDLKSQIKKKEEEMQPAKAVEKAAVKDVKPALPPLPNLGAMPQSSFGSVRDMQPVPKIPEIPQVVAIEGLDGVLFADIQSDWGGYARVSPDDTYHEYKIVEIAPNHVRARNAKGQIIQLTVLTSAIQRLQAKSAAPQQGGSSMSSMMGLNQPFPMTSLPSVPMPNPVISTPSSKEVEPVVAGKDDRASMQRRVIARRAAAK